jgi:hypothetical protein
MQSKPKVTDPIALAIVCTGCEHSVLAYAARRRVVLDCRAVIAVRNDCRVAGLLYSFSCLVLLQTAFPRSLFWLR